MIYVCIRDFDFTYLFIAQICPCVVSLCLSCLTCVCVFVTYLQASLGGGGVVIGENCTFGELATVKRSCVGARCNVGSKVKMNGCIIGDNVTIEEGVTLQDCLVASGAVISKGSTLKECKVAQGFVVPPASKSLQNKLVNSSLCSMHSLF